MRAWHFVGATLRDGDPIPADGELFSFDGTPVICGNGLHAALEPFDALQFAPGNTLCLVEMGGTIIHGDDKLVATERTIICRMDAEEMLRYYARMQALSVAHLWDIPDVVLEYLMTSNEEIREAAWDAAWAAAGPATWAAAWATAGNAAMSAARSAARKDFNDLVYECFSEWLED